MKHMIITAKSAFFIIISMQFSQINASIFHKMEHNKTSNQRLNKHSVETQTYSCSRVVNETIGKIQQKTISAKHIEEFNADNFLIYKSILDYEFSIINKDSKDFQALHFRKISNPLFQQDLNQIFENTNTKILFSEAISKINIAIENGVIHWGNVLRISKAFPHLHHNDTSNYNSDFGEYLSEFLLVKFCEKHESLPGYEKYARTLSNIYLQLSRVYSHFGEYYYNTNEFDEYCLHYTEYTNYIDYYNNERVKLPIFFSISGIHKKKIKLIQNSLFHNPKNKRAWAHFISFMVRDSDRNYIMDDPYYNNSFESLGVLDKNFIMEKIENLINLGPRIITCQIFDTLENFIQKENCRKSKKVFDFSFNLDAASF